MMLVELLDGTIYTTEKIVAGVDQLWFRSITIDGEEILVDVHPRDIKEITLLK